MIDKSIRQHYQNGEEVKKLKLVEMGEKLTSPLKEKYMPEGKIDVGEVAKTALTNKLTSAATKKLAGTGILSSLGPIGMLIAFMLAKKGMKYASDKWGEGGAKQAFTAGMTGTRADYETARELRSLENRRDWMQKRKDEGKSYSKKKLEEVTDQINTIKKTAPTVKKTSPISYEDDLATTTIKDILDKQYEHEDKKTAPLRTTPIIDYEYEAYNPPTAPIKQDPDTGDASIAERIAAENRAAAELQAEVTRQAEANAARIRAEQARAAGPHGNGGGGGHHGHTETRSSSGWESSPFKKGGRVDKALGGRVRDI